MELTALMGTFKALEIALDHCLDLCLDCGDLWSIIIFGLTCNVNSDNLHTLMCAFLNQDQSIELATGGL